MIAANPFDAIILDVRMPGMDGMQVLHRILHLAPQTPTILMTGDHLLSDSQAKSGYGAFAYLLKPYPILDLVALEETQWVGIARLGLGVSGVICHVGLEFCITPIRNRGYLRLRRTFGAIHGHHFGVYLEIPHPDHPHLALVMPFHWAITKEL
jgi:CheY-like chemotaxis protein